MDSSEQTVLPTRRHESTSSRAENAAVNQLSSGEIKRQDGAVITVIRPPLGWQLVNVTELWKFRELLAFLVWRDVKVRYKQTLLGAAWAVLQPAMMMVVFNVFFARMAKVPAGDMPYPLFVYAGLLPWSFFATSITNAANSVVGSERLITKIYFPRLAIPFASVGAAVVDFCCAFGLLIVMMLWYGVMPGWGLFLVPGLLACFALTAAGVGTALAALNVAYRDFRYVVPFIVQLWMFATPTIYMDPDANGAGTYDHLLIVNPLSPLVNSFRRAVLGGSVPWLQLGIAATVSIGIFVLGCLYFRRVEDGFSDII
jgi:lipopolysaccharide transport system permease protein